MKTLAELLDEFEKAVREHECAKIGIAEGHYHLGPSEQSAEDEVNRLRREVLRAATP